MEKNILMMDPNELVRDAMKLFLHDLGYHVDTGATAKNSWDLLAQGEYSIVICARYMPDMDGLLFVRLARKAYPQILAVLEADFGCNFQFIQEARDAGVSEFIQKPLNGDNITEMMMRLQQKIGQSDQQLQSEMWL